MQKWCPEAFSAEPTAASAEPAAGDRFARLAEQPAETTGTTRNFCRESRFADPASLLANLTQEERSLIFELVEQDVAREYEAREEELRRDFEAKQQEAEEAHAEALSRWATEFGDNLQSAWSERIGNLGRETARLAIRLAEKIVRRTVEQDPEVLVRAIEATLFKIHGSRGVTLAVHPDDAQWLDGREDLQEKLRIGTIEPDRRIQRGGGLIRAEDEEWDATVKGQLAALSEVVEELIATAGAERTQPDPEEQDATGLE